MRGCKAVDAVLTLPQVMRASCFAGLFLLFLSLLAHTASPAETPSESSLDEVEVRGEKLRLDQLRQELRRLEGKIYARFNEVNKIDKFDVICSDYARTGTRLEQRYCRPMFVEEALTSEGRVAFEARQKIFESQKMAGSVQLPDPLLPRVQAQVPAYQRQLQKLASADAQLRALLRERAAVAEQIKRTHRAMFGE